jgi:hypothetical protein
MTEVGFEPTIPVFGRTKTVHVLGRAAAVIGIANIYLCITGFLNYATQNEIHKQNKRDDRSEKPAFQYLAQYIKNLEREIKALFALKILKMWHTIFKLRFSYT